MIIRFIVVFRRFSDVSLSSLLRKVISFNLLWLRSRVVSSFKAINGVKFLNPLLYFKLSFVSLYNPLRISDNDWKVASRYDYTISIIMEGRSYSNIYLPNYWNNKTYNLQGCEI